MAKRFTLAALVWSLPAMSGCGALNMGSEGIRAIDHKVPHVSTVPANKGEQVQIFVREKVMTGDDQQARPVVLMVHGGVSPSTLAFDVEHETYSWMAYLARAGFDVFAMDMTGYGKSAHPMMDDPCNVGPRAAKDAHSRNPRRGLQAAVSVSIGKPPERARRARPRDRVHSRAARRRQDQSARLVGGGYRIGTYTSERPEKVEKLVIFASSNYSRKNPSAAPASLPAPGFPITIQSRELAEKQRWFPFAKCPDQIEPGMPDRIWELSKEHDPRGMTWGPGVMRAPTRTYWGWNAEEAKTHQGADLGHARRVR